MLQFKHKVDRVKIFYKQKNRWAILIGFAILLMIGSLYVIAYQPFLKNKGIHQANAKNEVQIFAEKTNNNLDSSLQNKSYSDSLQYCIVTIDSYNLSKNYIEASNVIEKCYKNIPNADAYWELSEVSGYLEKSAGNISKAKEYFTKAVNAYNKLPASQQNYPDRINSLKQEIDNK